MVPLENRIAAWRWNGKMERFRYVRKAAVVHYDLLTFTAQGPTGEVRKQHFKILRYILDLLIMRDANVSLHFRKKK